MLEQKEQTENESRSYLTYDANLLFKYKMKIIIARYMIEKYGVQVFLGEEPTVDETDNLLDFSIDKRKEIYRFMERNPDYSDDKLVKELFRESEYYPR